MALSPDPLCLVGPAPIWQKTAAGRFKHSGTGCGGAAQWRRRPIRCA